MGARGQALGYYQPALTIRQKLAAREPERTDFQRPGHQLLENVHDLSGGRQSAVAYKGAEYPEATARRQPSRLIRSRSDVADYYGGTGKEESDESAISQKGPAPGFFAATGKRSISPGLARTLLPGEQKARHPGRGAGP